MEPLLYVQVPPKAALRKKIKNKNKKIKNKNKK